MHLEGENSIHFPNKTFVVCLGILKAPELPGERGRGWAGMHPSFCELAVNFPALLGRGRYVVRRGSLCPLRRKSRFLLPHIRIRSESERGRLREPLPAQTGCSEGPRPACWRVGGGRLPRGSTWAAAAPRPPRPLPRTWHVLLQAADHLSAGHRAEQGISARCRRC